MKTYLLPLLLMLFFPLVMQAQKNDPCNGNSRPIEVENVTYPHNPCYQVVNVYTVLKESDDATINWQVVRSEMSDNPAEGWIIVNKDNHNEAGSAAGYEIIKGGKTYFAASIRAGRKTGVIKATVIAPSCGNGSKVATLTVRPGEMLVNLTAGACNDTEKTFTATATPSKHPNNATGYTYTWTYPTEWINKEEPTAIGSYVTTVNTLTLIATGDTEGTVSVDVVATFRGNNGQGVGNANCEFGAAELTTQPCTGTEEVCPAGIEETSPDRSIKFTYLGTATSSDDNTSVVFSVESNKIIDQLIVQLFALEPDPTITASINHPDYTVNYDEGTAEVIYTREPGATGTNNLTFSFTAPEESLLEIYGLFVYYTDGSGTFTTFEGNVFGEPLCSFQPLEALPVRLTSFQGKATASGINLTWTTASELDNERFDVQRSTNGNEFTSIGAVKGAGNTSHKVRYSFTDHTPASGTNYYRLKQIDTNGTAEYSEVIALVSLGATKTAGITVYPNPVTGSTIHIALHQNNHNSDTFVVLLSDINGRKVLEKQLTATNNELTLALDQFQVAKGLYLVKVQGEHTVITQRLLVK